ncbi:GH39 family glycosyl hydrolase [Nocardiopsis oceani]
MTQEHTTGTARSDWEARIGIASGAAVSTAPLLPPPTGLSAQDGRGQVTLTWNPIPHAVGYQVYRSEDPHGPFAPVDHRGLDVLAVPHPPYTDTTAEPGRTYHYTVATLSDVKVQGEQSPPVKATAQAQGAGVVEVAVDTSAGQGTLPRPWRPMVGSEHLSYLLEEDTSGGRPIGEELRAALAAASEHFGPRTVRAHGILCDDLGVYREVDGQPVHDFTGIDRVYDTVRDLGYRPVVELSFMPRDLAADPDKTVFEYGAVISPPKDYRRWYDLVHDLVTHLVDRYGLAEVRDEWSFEVWNEANLEVFWSGTPEEFWHLHDASVAAVKDVHPDLRVGGPSSAASGWVEEMLDHLDRVGPEGVNTALDFASTHTYGSPPLDVRPQLARHGRADTPVWWTEWGVTPQHFNAVNDSVFSAAFLARGMRSAAGRIEALSYWVVSDHFEELGRPPALMHGGFGLRTVGDLAKPRFWALSMLDRLGEEQLAVTATGDGADSLVESWAGADPDGRVAVVLWNGTLDQTKAAGAPLLDRTVRLRLDHLADGDYVLRHLRVDDGHSNVAERWRALGGAVRGSDEGMRPSAGEGAPEGSLWPDEGQWERLRRQDVLEPLHPERTVTVSGGSFEVDFDLPQPALSLVELVPVAE